MLFKSKGKKVCFILIIQLFILSSSTALFAEQKYKAEIKFIITNYTDEWKDLKITSLEFKKVSVEPKKRITVVVSMSRSTIFGGSTTSRIIDAQTGKELFTDQWQYGASKSKPFTSKTVYFNIRE